MFVYTLSTAGTFTKGDLPVYLVSVAQELAKVEYSNYSFFILSIIYMLMLVH